MAAASAALRGRAASAGRLAPLAEVPWLEAVPPEMAAGAAERRWPDPRGSPEAERLRFQFQNLWMEKRDETRRLQRIDADLEGSLLLERNAQRRAAKQQQQLDGHRRNAADVERKIARLLEEIELCESLTHPGPDSPSDGAAEGRSAPADAAQAASAPSQSGPQASGERAASKHKTGKSSSGPQPSSTPMPSMGRPVAREPSDRQLRPSASSPSLSRRAASQARRPSGSRLGSMPPSGHGGPALDAAPAQQRFPVRSPEEEESMRESLRQELIRLVGGPREAFREFDVNRSGGISLMEFNDGIARLGLNFTKITGLEKQQSVFRLFDSDKDGVINFAEMFPEEAARPPELPESAEEFYDFWLSHKRDFQRPFPGPRWEASGPDEELQMNIEASQLSADLAAKKKWMSSTIRRLKKRGKSDARCRELVALHLPRGTGPKDLQDVKTFSYGDVRACRKKYMEEWSVPSKKLQKVIVNMRDIKWDLRDLRDELYMVTEGRVSRLDEERRSAAAALLAPPEPAAGAGADEAGGDGPAQGEEPAEAGEEPEALTDCSDDE